MNRSEAINELATALAKAQADMPPVKKSLTAKIPTKAGGEYTYHYADLADCLDAIRKPLSDNGLALIQTVETDPGAISIETMLAHASGQWLAHTISFASSNDPRTTGSNITYGRRYGLCITGVVTEMDDDAGATTGEPTGTTLPTKAQPSGNAQKCPKCAGAMWDNREGKTNPKQPDFKCKDKTCDGVIWPPKQAPAQPEPPPNIQPAEPLQPAARDAAQLATLDAMPSAGDAPAGTHELQAMFGEAGKVYGKTEKAHEEFKAWLRQQKYITESTKELTRRQVNEIITRLRAEQQP